MWLLIQHELVPPLHDLAYFRHAVASTRREGVYRTMWYLALLYKVQGLRHGLVLIQDRFTRLCILDSRSIAIEAASNSGTSTNMVELDRLKSLWDDDDWGTGLSGAGAETFTACIMMALWCAGAHPAPTLAEAGLKSVPVHGSCEAGGLSALRNGQNCQGKEGSRSGEPRLDDIERGSTASDGNLDDDADLTFSVTSEGEYGLGHWRDRLIACGQTVRILNASEMDRVWMECARMPRFTNEA